MNPEKTLKLLASVCANVHKVANARLVAAIYYRGELVSIGYNQLKSDPFQAKHGEPEKIYLHAEIDAIKEALKRTSLKKLAASKMYICRLKAESDISNKLIWGLAKPCNGCKRAILKFGIREVVYTENGTGNYRKVKLNGTEEL